jgi:hypothetical protein
MHKGGPPARILLIALGCLAITATLRCQQPSNVVNIMSFELYSWRGSDGEWCFSILPSPSGRNVYAEEVFNKRFTLRGVKNLERKIAKLPKGATVLWLEQIPSSGGANAKSTGGLQFPPSEMIQEIRHYAQGHDVTIDVSAPEKL